MGRNRKPISLELFGIFSFCDIRAGLDWLLLPVTVLLPRAGPPWDEPDAVRD